MKPRHYQREAIAAICQRFDAGDRSTLIVLPTGAGKTIVAAHVADQMLSRGRVMVLAHRDELIRQAVDKFRTVTGVEPAVEKAGERSMEDGLHGKPQIVVSSFQTQNAGKTKKRMERFDPKEFSFLWIDECHHAVADSFRAVIAYYIKGNPDLKMLGVTATPDRSDDEGLGQIFQSAAYSYELPDAIRDGYLVPIRQRAVVIEGLDFSKCRTTAGDLNALDLEAAMMAEEPLHGVAHATIEIANGLEQHCLQKIKDDPLRASVLSGWLDGKRQRRTLIFTITVKHAAKLAEILNRWQPGSATHVAGDGGDDGMSLDIRKQRLASFSAGRVQYLVNCMIASEGYDEPGIELVVMGRPTKSRALAVQQIGRGTRPLKDLADILGDFPDDVARRQAIADSPKSFIEILDFVGNSGRHRLVTAADILGGGVYDESIIDRAAELAQDEAIDVTEALEQAQGEADEDAQMRLMFAENEAAMIEADDERRRSEASKRLAHVVATASYQVTEVDATNPYETTAPQQSHMEIAGNSKLATDKQVEFLGKLGVKRETAMRYSRRQAAAVIENLKAKRCTTGQANYLRRLGYADQVIARMNFEAASSAIDAASKAGAA